MSYFASKVVVITGAASGIGAATAKELSKQGALLSLIDLNQERLAQIADECEKLGAKDILQVVGDVSKQEDMERIIKETADKFGEIHVLVNSAGVFPAVLISTFTLDQFDRCFNVNVRAVLYLTQLALPYLEKTKGNIVNISSIASTSYNLPYGSIYCASKAACDHITKFSAIELAKSGIRVNAVNPSFVETNIFVNGGFTEKESKEMFADYGKMHPLNERNIKVEEVVDAILFLASDKATMITGSCLKVDGGIDLSGE
ncbi:3-oxoacyl-[acyl-carrier-protein] reductase FabG-like [Clavelina lepadiformis]|uniref:3-oxoacyl-[acyl-carrier-protein] reductase FabG-like n=1 Tax=Clavelina lepadiformis TaxID=159417 RepID=UPI0040412285